MLTDKEKKKIIELIKQGKTDYRIWKETGHSVNTIKPIRKDLEQAEKKQTHGEEVHSTSLIDVTRSFIARVNTALKTKKLSDREKKESEKLLESLREMLREEVDDRIAEERKDAVNKRDQEWKIILEKDYVKKEVKTALEHEIRKRDESIKELK